MRSRTSKLAREVARELKRLETDESKAVSSDVREYRSFLTAAMEKLRRASHKAQQIRGDAVSPAWTKQVKKLSGLIREVNNLLSGTPGV